MDDDKLRIDESEAFANATGASASTQQFRPQLDLSDDDKLRMYYAAEATVAKELGLRWQDRGPAGGPEAGGPHRWKRQNWRQGSQRYSNRGGRWRKWYRWKFQAIKAGRSEQEAIAFANERAEESSE